MTRWTNSLPMTRSFDVWSSTYIPFKQPQIPSFSTNLQLIRLCVRPSLVYSSNLSRTTPSLHPLLFSIPNTFLVSPCTIYESSQCPVHRPPAPEHHTLAVGALHPDTAALPSAAHYLSITLFFLFLTYFIYLYPFLFYFLLELIPGSFGDSFDWFIGCLFGGIAYQGRNRN